MTGHLAVPALDPSGAPATLSRKIVTDLLRKKMRFHGLVVTDALMMDALRGSDAKESRYSLHSSQMKDRDGRGLTRRSQDQILARAINAGCDILLMPEDPFFAHRKIVEMIKEGKIDRARIAESCARILAAKKWLTAKTPRIPTNLDAQCAAFARKTARAGILLDCEGARGLSPLRSAAEGVRRQGEVPILSGLREGSDARVRRTAGRPARRWGLTPNSPQACATLAPEILAILATPDRVLDFNPFAASLKCLAPSAAIRRISPAPSEKETAAILDAAEKNQTVILALYPVAAAWTDATRISPALKNLIAKIAERKNLIIISFGSPYIRREIPQAKNFICPFSDSPASQQAAAEILFR
jgi:beta-N-acetylhexosaminidase